MRAWCTCLKAETRFSSGQVEAKLSARPRKGATRQEEDATRAVQELLALAFSSEVSSKILGAKSVMSDQADPDI